MHVLKEREKVRLREQARLDGRLSARERNRRGQFATPPALARAMAAHAVRVWKGRPERIRFLDPAIGTGVFYAAALDALPEGAIEAAAGFERDRELAAAARRIWRGTSLRVMQRDFTSSRPPAPARRYNLILANPPYVRHQHLGREEKARLRRRVAGELGIAVSGLASLYCYFLLLSDAWLAPRGLACWLIPTEFMNVAYGSAVRRYLTERVRMIHLHRFRPGEAQFPDALVSSAVVVFQKEDCAFRRTPLLSLGGSMARPKVRQRVASARLAAENKWMRYPGGQRVQAAPADDRPALGDFFEIKRGIATGSNRFFIMTKEQARRRGVPSRYLKPVLPGPRRLTETVIEAAPDGHPSIRGPLVLIDCDLPESEVRRTAYGLWVYLQEGKKQNVHQGYLASRRSPWYSQEQRPPPPFLCSYMGRRGRSGAKPFRFFWNKSQATATNVYLLLYPKASARRVLNDHPAMLGELFDALQGVSGEALAAEGRVYGGGLYKLEPNELARAPAGPVAEAVRRMGQSAIRLRGSGARPPRSPRSH